MDASDCDIASYAWIDHESIGFPSSHIDTLELFRDSVVRPSLRALDAEIQKHQGSENPAAAFFVDDYAALSQTTVEGYLIALQSMWERGLRSMLILREKSLIHDAQPAVLERALWGDKPACLQGHFQRLMGLPLQAFESYSDLDLLQGLGSAIRHGDGAAARRVHQLCPMLWFNWIAPGEEIVAGPFRITAPLDSPKSPSFDKITLPEAVLEQMIQSVLWFWEDIENMRCNSFRHQHHSVLAKLSAWQAERPCRRGARLWHPVDGAFPRSVATRSS